ncbi:MAG: hypothetical protein LC804_25085 [Acidobacteria bacterium]|nr:hypothetical protein [Acidobacteriota bacterium]
MPHAGRVDVKVARLRVLEKRGRDARREWIRVDDDRLGVVRDEDFENPAKEIPRGLARLDRPRGRLLESGIDEAMPRADRREDPRAKPPTLPLGQREPADPARIDLQLLARLPIEHRDRRRGLAKLQLEDRETVQRGIGDLDAVPDEQLPNLGEPDAVTEPALDRGPLLETARPAVATRSSTGGMQCEQDLTDLLVADHRRATDAGGRGRREIPADRFRIEPELGGDPLLRQALAAEPKDFPDFNHGDLAIHPCLLAPSAARSRRPLSRGQAKGEKGFETLAPQGGKRFEKPHARGGKGFEKVVKKGSLRFENRQTAASMPEPGRMRYA